jgi:hypothetical protein
LALDPGFATVEGRLDPSATVHGRAAVHLRGRVGGVGWRFRAMRSQRQSSAGWGGQQQRRGFTRPCVAAGVCRGRMWYIASDGRGGPQWKCVSGGLTYGRSRGDWRRARKNDSGVRSCNAGRGGEREESMGGCARRVSRQARSARKDELVQTGVCRTDWGGDSLPAPQGNEDEGLKLSSIVAASLRRRFRPWSASCAALMGHGSCPRACQPWAQVGRRDARHSILSLRSL